MRLVDRNSHQNRLNVDVNATLRECEQFIISVANVFT